MTNSLSVQYVSGLTFDAKGRVQLQPGAAGRMTGESQHLVVEFASHQRLTIDWGLAKAIEVRGDDQAKRAPGDGALATSLASVFFRRREFWSYLAVTDDSGQEIIFKVHGVPASRLQEWVLAVGRPLGRSGTEASN